MACFRSCITILILCSPIYVPHHSGVLGDNTPAHPGVRIQAIPCLLPDMNVAESLASESRTSHRQLITEVTIRVFTMAKRIWCQTVTSLVEHVDHWALAHRTTSPYNWETRLLMLDDNDHSLPLLVSSILSIIIFDKESLPPESIQLSWVTVGFSLLGQPQLEAV